MQARQAFAPFCLLLGILPIAVYFDLWTAHIPHMKGGASSSPPVHYRSIEGIVTEFSALIEVTGEMRILSGSR
jgi:hypothetical protein